MATLSIPREMLADIVIPSGTTNPTSFNVAFVPGGLRLKDASLYLPGTLGASTTLSLGDTGYTTGSPGSVTTTALSTTRYIAATASTGATKMSLTDTLAGNVGLTVGTSGTTFTVTLAGATTGTAQTISVFLKFVESF